MQPTRSSQSRVMSRPPRYTLRYYDTSATFRQGNRCLATLGAGQLDRFGNINASWNADGSFIVGSGGSNDLANAAAELLIVAAQRKRTFRERVDFVTSPGQRVRAVVSTMGVYEKRPHGHAIGDGDGDGDGHADGELVLTGVFESAGPSREAVVEQIRENCGWPLRVADELAWLPGASDEELAMLRVFDPARAFLGKGTKGSNGTMKKEPA